MAEAPLDPKAVIAAESNDAMMEQLDRLTEEWKKWVGQDREYTNKQNQPIVVSFGPSDNELAGP